MITKHPPGTTVLAWGRLVYPRAGVLADRYVRAYLGHAPECRCAGDGCIEKEDGEEARRRLSTKFAMVDP